MWRSERMYFKSALRDLRRDESGVAAVEFGLLGGFFILLLLAAMDFGVALWQHNRAAKAVQLGVRLAAVSDPVSKDLATFDGTQVGAQPGDPMPYFERRCNGSMGTCTGGSFDLGALQTIVYGRGNTSCPTAPQPYPAMCQILPQVTPANIAIDYVHSGIGLAGISGIRPIPTITMRLIGLSYDFILLGDLLGLRGIPMTGLMATATGEDLTGR